MRGGFLHGRQMERTDGGDRAEGSGKGLDVGDEVEGYVLGIMVNAEHHWPRDPVIGDITSRESLNP